MDISRRKFLKATFGAAGFALSYTHLLPLALGAELAPRRKGIDKVLVVVQMAGGNDGLNTVIPYGAGQYYQTRPTLAVAEQDVLPLNGQIGLPKSMTALEELFKGNKVAIALGVGYPSPNRSHFRSMEIWQTAEPNRIVDTGWLGRYLDLATPSGSSDELFPAINVDPILPKTLSAAKVVVPSVTNPNQFRFATDPHYNQDRQIQISTFTDIYSTYDSNRPESELLTKVGLDTLKASDHLLSVVKSYKSNVQYPNNGFAGGLKFIAQMITAGVGARVYNITLPGFDTHANQSRVQSNLLKQLAEGLSAFQADLEAHGVDQDVLVMTWSEFGRRVAENGGRGTDHGTAAPLFVLGSAVKGGIYGDYPNLANLDNGDLKYLVDFRTIYATILDRWLGADSQQVLGGRFDSLPFV